MGPPARPLDNKPTDINELGDVLAGSGVDLREEEAALLGSYSRSGQQRQDTGYGPNLGKPFGSNYPIPQGNFYSQNFPGDRNSFYGAGTFNQRPAPFQSAEAIAAADREKAIRRKAEIKSYHLNDPFLFTGCLQRRIAKQAQNMQVVVPQAGLLHSTTPQHVAHELYVQGPDKNEVLKVVKGEDLLQTDSLYAEILSLLSLATEERLRTLVEDAATLAKGRRIGAHGIVPVELADIAIGSGASETVTGLPMQGNSVVSPTSNPLKRKL